MLLSSLAALSDGADRGSLFDAHLHYNDDAQQPPPPADVLARMDRAAGVLVNSWSNNDVLRLLAKHPGRLGQWPADARTSPLKRGLGWRIAATAPSR